MSAGLLVRDATAAESGRRRIDVRIRDGRIAELAAAGSLTPTGGERTLDAAGRLLLTAPAEPHAHLDKALTADRFDGPATDLPMAVARWHEHRATLTVQDIAERAERAALAQLAYGATAVRTHVDVGAGIGLRGIEALVAVRERLRERMTLQIVAMAYPVAGEIGSDNRGLLERAVALGADLLGGAPHITPDPAGDLVVALELAERLGVGVDLHTDERLDVSHGLEQLCRRCADGFALPATASHCVSLGMRPLETQQEIARLVSGSGVGVVCCPQTNLLLQGAGMPVATPRGLTAVAALRSAGARLTAGGDNVRDAFNPIGSGDPIHTAQLLVAAAHVTPAVAYDLVSVAAREVMGLAAEPVAVGAAADLLLIAAGDVGEAVAVASQDRIVIRSGTVVARTTVTSEEYDQHAA